jgi:hypothetical protein
LSLKLVKHGKKRCNASSLYRFLIHTSGVCGLHLVKIGPMKGLIDSAEFALLIVWAIQDVTDDTTGDVTQDGTN